jgi:hypothetical protein
MIAPIVLTMLLSSQSPAGPACRVPALDAFAFYAGTWQVTLDARLSKEGPWEQTPAASAIRPEMMGCAFIERLDTTRRGKPLQLLSILTYDQNGSKWQLTVTDSEHGRMQTYEGRDDGTAVVLLVNLEIPGGKVLLRRTLIRDGADAFRWESARSTDEGKTWDVTGRMNYRRAAVTRSPAN